jgi:hypothetical protein
MLKSDKLSRRQRKLAIIQREEADQEEARKLAVRYQN